jgi:hypothetical protein
VSYWHLSRVLHGHCQPGPITAMRVARGFQRLNIPLPEGEAPCVLND